MAVGLGPAAGFPRRHRPDDRRAVSPPGKDRCPGQPETGRGDPRGRGPAQSRRHGARPVDRRTEERSSSFCPGPPPELQSICETHVWPRLSGRNRSFLARQVLKTAGLTESEVEGLIDGLYPRDPGPPPDDPRFAGANRTSRVRLLGRLRGGSRTGRRTPWPPSLRTRLGRAVFSDDGADLETVVGRLLSGRKETVAVAESCTGGLVCRRLTRIPGSSAYFLEGFVTYCNQAKIDRLGVPAEMIESFGAVSAENGRGRWPKESGARPAPITAWRSPESPVRPGERPKNRSAWFIARSPAPTAPQVERSFSRRPTPHPGSIRPKSPRHAPSPSRRKGRAR